MEVKVKFAKLNRDIENKKKHWGKQAQYVSFSLLSPIGLILKEHGSQDLGDVKNMSYYYYF